MASPHVAGVAALAPGAPDVVGRGHQGGDLNTGDLGQSVRPTTDTRVAVGTGPRPAASRPRRRSSPTSADEFAVSVNFGYGELLANYSKTRDHASRTTARPPPRSARRAARSRASHTRSRGVVGDVPAVGRPVVHVDATRPRCRTRARDAVAGRAFREAAWLSEASGLVLVTQRRPAPRAVPWCPVPRRRTKALASPQRRQGHVGDDQHAGEGVTHGRRAARLPLEGRRVRGGHLGPASDARHRRPVVRTRCADVGTRVPPGGRALYFGVATHADWARSGERVRQFTVEVDRDKKADYIVVGVHDALHLRHDNDPMDVFVVARGSPAGRSIHERVQLEREHGAVQQRCPLDPGRQLCRARAAGGGDVDQVPDRRLQPVLGLDRHDAVGHATTSRRRA